MDGQKLTPSLCRHTRLGILKQRILTLVVVVDRVSRTNTSITLLVSLVIRFVASEANATKRPSAERLGKSLSLLPWTPETASQADARRRLGHAVTDEDV